MRTKSLDERLAATDAGGFPRVSLFPQDFEEMGDELDPGTIRTRCRDAGVDVAVLDPFARWLPDEYWDPPERFSDAEVAWLDYTGDEFFGIASALDVEKITVIEPFGVEVPVPAAARAFGTCCDRAAEHGIDVMLEFMATASIDTLEQAWEIVDRADRENGGLLLDTWHYFRGDPDNELLATLPGEKVFAVQLADGHAEFDWPLAVDMLHHRLLPGEGDFPLAETVATLADIGGLRAVGPEVFSDDLDELPAEEVGQRAGETTRETLDAAGVSVDWG